MVDVEIVRLERGLGTGNFYGLQDELRDEGFEAVVWGPLSDRPFELSVVAVTGRRASRVEAAEGIGDVTFAVESLVAELDGTVCRGFCFLPAQLTEERPELCGGVLGVGLHDALLPHAAA